MTKTINPETAAKIRELDHRYDETVREIRFHRGEAYLAKSASPYVKRSQLPSIENRIKVLQDEQLANFAQLVEIKEAQGLTWGEIIDISTDKTEIRA